MGRYAPISRPKSPPLTTLKVEGRPVRAKEFVYLLLNKPRGLPDHASRREIPKDDLRLAPGKMPKLAHVGRLDKESEGLLLLTNDGELALRMTHPRFKLEKEYLVTLDQEFQMADLPKVLKGVYLAEGRAKFDAAV